MTSPAEYSELNTSDNDLLDRSAVQDQSYPQDTVLNLTPEKPTKSPVSDSPEPLLASQDESILSTQPSRSEGLYAHNERILEAEVRSVSSLLLGLIRSLVNKISTLMKYIHLYIVFQNILILVLLYLRLINVKITLIYFIISTFIYFFLKIRLWCLRSSSHISEDNGAVPADNFYFQEEQQSHTDILPSQQAGASGPDNSGLELDGLEEFSDERLRNLYIGLRILSAMGVSRERGGARRTYGTGSSSRALGRELPRRVTGDRESGLETSHLALHPIIDRILRDSLQNPTNARTSHRGLNERQINNLHSFKYNKKDQQLGNNLEDAQERQCIICFEEYENDQDVKALPCIHSYHKSCIDKWLRSHNSCPVCKHKVIESL
jgi:hypothetical protein